MHQDLHLKILFIGTDSLDQDILTKSKHILNKVIFTTTKIYDISITEKGFIKDSWYSRNRLSSCILTHSEQVIHSLAEETI